MAKTENAKSLILFAARGAKSLARHPPLSIWFYLGFAVRCATPYNFVIEGGPFLGPPFLRRKNRQDRGPFHEA